MSAFASSTSPRESGSGSSSPPKAATTAAGAATSSPTSLSSAAVAVAVAPTKRDIIGVQQEGELGDLFAPELWPGPSTICRAWHFTTPAVTATTSTTAGGGGGDGGVEEAMSYGRRDPPLVGHKVCLRHGPATGTWILIVDGIFRSRGFEALIVRSFQIAFTLDNLNVVIECTGTSSINFYHTLKIDGVEFPELRTVVDCSIGERPPRRLGIPDTRKDYEGKKQVTLYQLFVEPASSSGGASCVIERRYSEFSMLDLVIRAQTDAHLLSSLPSLPGKVFNPLTDQSSEAFISQRREALQHYLNQLLLNSKILHYSELFSFLGLHPITGEPIRPPYSCSDVDA